MKQQDIETKEKFYISGASSLILPFLGALSGDQGMLLA